ncbi:hypothetical protein EX30DRAFT_343223 [Ascodesmis nigricans]|uniref:CENP-V/GFA domain-containing protein n=1 Tax=Ascodesmis nigricans TaxID=341454 RepID=A0A4S2MS51_9PEZI|nr:hypothetical protein EX30DRAFT_343223 [Ascodesmis nigricans]
MVHTFTGSCYCGSIQYTVSLDSLDQARTSICHCRNCRKFTGGPSGITTKLPRSTLTITSGAPKTHVSDNGSGTKLTREFCGECGSGIAEYGENAGENTYVFYGSFDEEGLEKLAPKGEFFTKYRREWNPPVPGTFQKKEIKE